MSKYREAPCVHYVAYMECQQGRDASHKTYCQHCRLYEPRTKVKHRNKKKDVIRRYSKVVAMDLG